MSNRFQPPAATMIKAPLIAAGCLIFSVSLHAAESKLESNSPFLPPGYNTKKAEAPKPVAKHKGPLSRELEFRGVVQLEGAFQFSLFHKSENRGYWITENGSENGVSVRNFNLDDMSISVTLNGRTEQLTLMTATDSPLPVATSVAAKPNKQHTQPTQPNIPGLTTTKKSSSNNKSRVIPRRRVILPKKK